MKSLVRNKPNNNLMYSDNNSEQFVATFIGTQWLIDKQIFDNRDEDLFNEDIGNFIRDEYDMLIDGMSSEGVLMSTARSNGVESNWEVYQFFSREDIGAPQEVFTYVNDEGEVIPFTNKEINQIENWELGDGAAVEGIEGHHLHPVHFHSEDIDLAADSNNIVFATELGHLNHLHDGNTTNYTPDQYLNHDNIYTHEEMLDITLDYRYDKYTMNASAYEDIGIFAYAGIGILSSVTVFSSVKAVFEWRRLRHSSFTNHLKRKLILHQTINNSMTGSLVATSAISAKMSYDMFFQDTSLEILGSELLLSSFDLIIGFGVARFVTGLMKYTVERRIKSNEKLANQQLERHLTQTFMEMAVFTGIGFGAVGINEVFQSFGEDSIYSLFDPTLIMTASILTYKVIKIGKSLHDRQRNTKAYEECRDIRFQHMIDLAHNENSLQPILK